MDRRYTPEYNFCRFDVCEMCMQSGFYLRFHIRWM